APEIALGDRDDQAQVRLHQLALGLAHRAIASLDLLEQGTEVLAREAGPLLERAQLARRRWGMAPPACPVERADLLPAPPHPSNDVVDQRGLERHLGDCLLDRLTGHADRRGGVPAID